VQTLSTYLRSLARVGKMFFLSKDGGRQQLAFLGKVTELVISFHSENSFFRYSGYWAELSP
jgi:hypothetical protein